jgi:hypothetical protein
MMFLRCDEFRVKNAAKRMMKHFDMKIELFGVDKLGRDITLNDFDPFDIECLNAGFFQVLPTRDRAGRAILCKVWYHQKYQTKENVVRITGLGGKIF